MADHLNREEIITAAEKIFTAFTLTCEQLDEAAFFKAPAENKWCVAEHVQHLITSTNITTLAYSLPLFIVRLAGGTPNRKSRTYNELVEKYRLKLSQGGRASGVFVPKKAGLSREELIKKWEKQSVKFIAALKKTGTDNRLDNYLAKHPLLGRITLRELCYFTIYHTEHHLNTIKAI
jgi:hypothetical protein